MTRYRILWEECLQGNILILLGEMGEMGRLTSLWMELPSPWTPGLYEMGKGDLHTSLWMRWDQQLLPL